jgi:hypothetical protein
MTDEPKLKKLTVPEFAEMMAQQFGGIELQPWQRGIFAMIERGDRVHVGHVRVPLTLQSLNFAISQRLLDEDAKLQERIDTSVRLNPLTGFGCSFVFIDEPEAPSPEPGTLTEAQAARAIALAMRDAEDYAIMYGRHMPIGTYKLALDVRVTQVREEAANGKS